MESDQRHHATETGDSVLEPVALLILPWSNNLLTGAAEARIHRCVMRCVIGEIAQCSLGTNHSDAIKTQTGLMIPSLPLRVLKRQCGTLT